MSSPTVPFYPMTHDDAEDQNVLLGEIRDAIITGMDQSILAENFSAGNSYVIGDYVNYNKKLYRFTAAHSGPWSDADAEEVNVGEELTNLNVGKSDVGHVHDDRYYTEAESDALLDGKSDVGHTHDDRYYTGTETDTLLDGKSNVGHIHDDRYYTIDVQNLFKTEIEGTTQTVYFDAEGTPTSVIHTANNQVVRTDSFVFGKDTVTETRTLSDGRYITMITNLTTLVTVISDIQEA